MKILVIESSPHKNGSSNLLADNFIKGAQEKGHETVVFDAARAELNPCLGCDFCGMDGPCSQNDDGEYLKEQIMSSDMMVFVTPLYYFGVSAQLKTVIDRFYSFTVRLSSRKIKTALIVAAWDSNEWTMREVESYYDTLCRYMNFEDRGKILGTGCGTVPMTRHTDFPQRAYELGRSLES